MNDQYPPEFFDKWAPVTKSAAEIIVPLVLGAVGVSSVLDVGCGLGHWLGEFRRHGIDDFLGLDGDHVPQDRLVIPRERFQARDLTLSFDLGRKFDLVTCLEVAEHLPAEKAEQFVECLTWHAPVILFSAAIPAQGGSGHVNCQWPSWWAERFIKHGFIAYDPRPTIWNDPDIAWWYRQNLLIFVSDVVVPMRFRQAGPDLDRVHPQHWREKTRVWT